MSTSRAPLLKNTQRSYEPHGVYYYRYHRMRTYAVALATFAAVSSLLFLTALYERPVRWPGAAHPLARLTGHEAQQTGAASSNTTSCLDANADDPGDGSLKSYLPSLPLGAHLKQWRPCCGTKASVPLFVSSHWDGSSSVTSAYIVQHGAANDPDRYFTVLRELVGKNSLIASPGFFKTGTSTAPDTFFLPEVNMAWQSARSSWPAGEDAVAPNSGRASLHKVGCSSYAIYDALLDRFANKKLYPNLKKVYLVGHSGGANFISRYAQVHDHKHEGAYHLRYVVANAAHHAYFTDARPTTDSQDCTQAFSWPYQFADDGSMPPYVKTRFDAVRSKRAVQARATQPDLNAAREAFKRWMTRDVVLLVGDKDTSTSGTQNCAAKSQGGSARRNRNYAYWAMENLLGRTGKDVSAFHGYQTLRDQGLGGPGQWQGNQPRSIDLVKRGDTAHQVCIVEDVGHDFGEMMDSECGASALKGDMVLPAGGSPQ